MRARSLIITTFLAALLFGAPFGLASKTVLAAATTQVNATAQVAVCGNGIREGGEQCDGADLGGMSCPGVGFDGGALACLAPCEYGFSACATAAAAVQAVTFSAATGGQHALTNADGTSLTVSVPPWFHDGDATMLVFSYLNASVAGTMPPPASGLAFVGNAYAVQFVDEGGAALTTLLQPATLEIAYAQSAVAGRNEATVAPYRRPTGGSSWIALGGATLDATDNTVTFSTSAFSHFALFAAPPASNPGNGGGGGGGGGGNGNGNPNGSPQEPLEVMFSGQASPDAAVTLLLDGVPVATTLADNQAAFSATTTVPWPGAYAFGLYQVDADGTRSTTLSFPVVVNPGTPASVGGVFFPPTIRADALEVSQGESIRVSGRSVPNGDVAVSRGFGGESVARVRARQDGSYELRLDTSSVEAGEYVLRAKAEREKKASPYGRSLRLVVRQKAAPLSLPSILGRPVAAPRTQDAASPVAVVDLSKLQGPASPTREVFRKDEEGSETLVQRPKRRSFIVRFFGWIAGIFRSIVAFASR